MLRFRLFRCALLIGALVLLAGCARGAKPSPALTPTVASTPTGLPETATSIPVTPTVAPATPASAAVMPPAQPSDVEPAEAVALPPVPRAVTDAETQAFFVGVPAGDAYTPMSLAVDPARDLAYVYHSDSAERRAVVSVVDLKRQQVVRVIRLSGMQPGGYGRILLSPDGRQGYVIDGMAQTLTAFDPDTGVLGRAVPEIVDGQLSADGRVLYALGPWGVRAFNLKELLGGDAVPLWSTAADSSAQMAVSGDSLLIGVTVPEAQLRLLDAMTGRELGDDFTRRVSFGRGSRPG